RKLGFCKATVKLKRAAGQLGIVCYQLDDMGQYMYEDPEATRPGVRSCTKGNEGEQNLPGAGRTRGTARPPPSLRDAAAPSGARSAPRRLRHTCRSAARTSGRRRWLRHASDGKRQALRKPECPDPVRCDGSTRLELPP